MKIKDKNLLEELRNEYSNGSELEKEVLESVIAKDEAWWSYMLDVSKYGCVSGSVLELIYYNDTANFHDNFEDEIDELIDNALDSSGMSFSEMASSIDVWDIQQLKNWKAWFAYEETINQFISTVERLEEQKEEE